jgi:hypothetical protein
MPVELFHDSVHCHIESECQAHQKELEHSQAMLMVALKGSCDELAQKLESSESRSQQVALLSADSSEAHLIGARPCDRCAAG